MELSVDMSERLTRDFFLRALADFMTKSALPSVKKVSIDCCPLDKKGDMIHLVVYSFDIHGGYSMSFPKKVRIPLKFKNEQLFMEAIPACVQRVFSECPSVVPELSEDIKKLAGSHFRSLLPIS